MWRNNGEAINMDQPIVKKNVGDLQNQSWVSWNDTKKLGAFAQWGFEQATKVPRLAALRTVKRVSAHFLFTIFSFFPFFF